MAHANGATHISHASIPGITALSALQAHDKTALRISDEPTGRVAIHFAETLSSTDRQALHRETGIFIEEIPHS